MIPYPPVGPLWGSEIPARAEILEGDVWGALEIEHAPLPRMPGGRIENLRGSRPHAAPPRIHWVPAALAAAPRQGSRRPFGPRASKCVTTHHDAFPRGVSLGLPLPPPGLRAASPSFRSTIKWLYQAFGLS